MQNSVEIFSIALGLVEPWYVKDIVLPLFRPLDQPFTYMKAF